MKEITSHRRRLNSNHNKREKVDSHNGKETRKRLLGLALSNLGRLNSRHLLCPTLRRLRFLDGTEVIGGKTRDAHVVVPFEDELDVTEFEGRGGAEFGEAAGCGYHVVDEVVGHLEDKLSFT